MWQFRFLPIFIRRWATKFEYFMKLFHLSMIKEECLTDQSNPPTANPSNAFIVHFSYTPYVQNFEQSVQKKKKKNWQISKKQDSFSLQQRWTFIQILYWFPTYRVQWQNYCLWQVVWIKVCFGLLARKRETCQKHLGNISKRQLEHNGNVKRI